MRAFKATVQALVSHPTIAVAIARLLIDDILDLRGQFISMTLKWILIVISPKLVPSQDGWQLGSLRRRARIERRYPGFFSGDTLRLRIHAPRSRYRHRHQSHKS